MVSSALDALDGPLYYLDGARHNEGIIDLALLKLPEGKAALVFTSQARAGAHLGALPQGVTVVCVNDLRAKEELFRAALARGATTLWFDTPVGDQALASYPLGRALEYILSYKRQSACL